MRKQVGYTLTELVTVVLCLALAAGAAWGWVWNIIKLVGMGLDPITGLLIVRAIGIFVVPVGCIVGYV